MKRTSGPIGADQRITLENFRDVLGDAGEPEKELRLIREDRRTLRLTTAKRRWWGRAVRFLFGPTKRDREDNKRIWGDLLADVQERSNRPYRGAVIFAAAHRARVDSRTDRVSIDATPTTELVRGALALEDRVKTEAESQGEASWQADGEGDAADSRVEPRLSLEDFRQAAEGDAKKALRLVREENKETGQVTVRLTAAEPERWGRIRRFLFGPAKEERDNNERILGDLLARLREAMDGSFNGAVIFAAAYGGKSRVDPGTGEVSFDDQAFTRAPKAGFIRQALAIAERVQAEETLARAYQQVDETLERTRAIVRRQAAYDMVSLDTAVEPADDQKEKEKVKEKEKEKEGEAEAKRDEEGGNDAASGARSTAGSYETLQTKTGNRDDYEEVERLLVHRLEAMPPYAQGYFYRRFDDQLVEAASDAVAQGQALTRMDIVQITEKIATHIERLTRIIEAVLGSRVRAMDVPQQRHLHRRLHAHLVERASTASGPGPVAALTEADAARIGMAVATEAALGDRLTAMEAPKLRYFLRLLHDQLVEAVSNAAGQAGALPEEDAVQIGTDVAAYVESLTSFKAFQLTTVSRTAEFHAGSALRAIGGTAGHVEPELWNALASLLKKAYQGDLIVAGALGRADRGPGDQQRPLRNAVSRIVGGWREKVVSDLYNQALEPNSNARKLAFVVELLNQDRNFKVSDQHDTLRRVDLAAGLLIEALQRRAGEQLGNDIIGKARDLAATAAGNDGRTFDIYRWVSGESAEGVLQAAGFPEKREFTDFLNRLVALVERASRDMSSRSEEDGSSSDVPAGRTTSNASSVSE